ncbi:MAG: hypothetical protein ABIJ56_23590 [Pseudomonadota bacterium]
MKKEKSAGHPVVILAAALVFSAGCGNGDSDSDADAADVPAETDMAGDADAAGDPEPEEITPDPGDEEAGDDAAEVVEDAESEDIEEEEEVITVECEVDGDGTASLGGILRRGTNMIMDTEDEDLDAAGDIIIAIFDEDPVTTLSPEPVASTIVFDADLGEETGYVEFCIQNIPPGAVWFGALMDDNDSGLESEMKVGDLITYPPPPETLAADVAVVDAAYVMNVRVGRVFGEVTIDAEFAATQDDLTGSLYVAVIDNPLASSPAILGYSMTEAVTLSADAGQPYELLLGAEPTVAETGYVIAIFDVDESGVYLMPSPGDLVNMSLDPIVLPPIFSYTITGIEEEQDTTIIWEYVE